MTIFMYGNGFNKHQNAIHTAKKLLNFSLSFYEESNLTEERITN